MTIVFSAATNNFIVMTVDSAITETHGHIRDYPSGIKSYSYPGIGCIATWGERRGHNKLAEKRVLVDLQSFQDLDNFVKDFIKETYPSDQDKHEDVGYHVAGFDQQGNAHLYHRFWGTPRPNPNQVAQDYRFCDHSPSSKYPLQLVYNGRNDIAYTIITMLLDEIKSGKDVCFDIETPVGIACLGDYIARMAGELTQEVGPPFTTYLIAPDNQIEIIRNKAFLPIDPEKVTMAFRLLQTPRKSEAVTNHYIHKLNPSQSTQLSAGTATSFIARPTEDNIDPY